MEFGLTRVNPSRARPGRPHWTTPQRGAADCVPANVPASKIAETAIENSTCIPRLLGWTSSQVGWVGRRPRFKFFLGILVFFLSIYTIHTVFTRCSQQFRRSFRAVPSKILSHTYHTRVKVNPGGVGGGGRGGESVSEG